MHLGLVAPLPPVPAGGAEYVAALLPYLARHAEVSCFVDNVEEVDADLRAAYRVRPLEERHDPDVDMLVYHIGNNPHHAFVFDAAMEGPAGIIEVHDGSMHHYLQESTLGREKNPFAYAQLGEEAHGYAGRRLAEMRMSRFRGTIEMFLYDYLSPMLDRARGVIVHSEYANHLVQLRSPRVHSWVVPHFAPDFGEPSNDRSWTGVDDDTLLIANLGFITTPKRPFVSLQALRNVLNRGLKAHMAFVGRDDMHGALQAEVARLGLQDHVTITGYVETGELRQWAQAVDVIVNLRAPHVGESSGALSYGLAAGKPVIIQPVGSWADFPADTVVRIPVTDDDAIPLAATIFALGQDPRLRNRYGNAARQYAHEELDADTCAQNVIRAASLALESEWVPPSWFVPSRNVGARTFLESSRVRIESLLSEDSPIAGDIAHAALRCITPARPKARLLAVDAPPRLLQLLGTVWGYEVDVRSWYGDAATKNLDMRAGIPAFSYSTALMTNDLPVSSYDVVLAGPPSAELDTFLSDCNKALTPQGLLAMFMNTLPEKTMERFGFSTHLHPDQPGWPVHAGGAHPRITVGTKALLPSTVS